MDSPICMIKFKLSGLFACTREYTGVTIQETRGINHNHWSQRPLSEAQINYVAGDFHCLRELYNYFQQSGYIHSLKNQVTEGTIRYIKRVYNNQPPPHTTDHNISYYQNSLLPLGILDTITGSGSYRLITCNGCNSPLSSHHFSNASKKKQPMCNVCRAIHIQRSVQAQWDRSSNDDYY